MTYHNFISSERWYCNVIGAARVHINKYISYTNKIKTVQPTMISLGASIVVPYYWMVFNVTFYGYTIVPLLIN